MSCKEEKIMQGALEQLDENKLNQREKEVSSGDAGLVSLPLKPPPSKRNSMIYDIDENKVSCRRQSIMIVEDYILSDDKSRRLHSRISITDFKKQLSKKKSYGYAMQYRPRYCEPNGCKKEQEEEEAKNLQEDTKLLQSYLVEDEMNTSLDYVVEALRKEENQNPNRYSTGDTITRCVMCNRILYDLIPYEKSDRLKDCVCSNCIKSYNSMIETINNYEYISSPLSTDDIFYSNNNNKSKEFSNKLKKALRDLLK